MEGADKSTKLWRTPYPALSCNFALEDKRQKESRHDFFLRKFEFTKALDQVLKPYIQQKLPEYTSGGTSWKLPSLAATRSLWPACCSTSQNTSTTQDSCPCSWRSPKVYSVKYLNSQNWSKLVGRFIFCFISMSFHFFCFISMSFHILLYFRVTWA